MGNQVQKSTNGDHMSSYVQKTNSINNGIKLRCVVERITYQNPENGYTVLKCAVKNEKDLVTVVGNLLDVNIGSVLLIDGNWKIDGKNGKQF